MTRHRASRSLLAAALAATLSLPAMAVLPDSGMWAIDGEVNGKPGRGIQIDRQGGTTLIVTYFGYRTDGSSMFLQASGALQDGKTFTADLTEFRNGRAIGGPARDGEAGQVLGPVTITFDSTTTATMTLPGEGPQKISRFQFEDLLRRLNNTFWGTTNAAWTVPASRGTLDITASAGTFVMQETTEWRTCRYSGDLVTAGAGFRSQGSVVCSVGLPLNYRMEDLTVDTSGILTGRLYRYVPDGSETGAPQVERETITGLCRTKGFTFAVLQPFFWPCNASELGLGNEGRK